MSATATATSEGTRPRRRLIGQLWFWVVIAIALGIVFGLVAPDTAKKAKWLADAFIQLIKTVTGPVIFVTVVIGIASLGNLARPAASRSAPWPTSSARRWSPSRSACSRPTSSSPGRASRDR